MSSVSQAIPSAERSQWLGSQAEESSYRIPFSGKDSHVNEDLSRSRYGHWHVILDRYLVAAGVTIHTCFVR